MIFYRLAWQRFVTYFHLDELFKDDEAHEKLLLLLHKKPKVEHKTKLLTDRTLNLYISILLSIISMLVCLSIPFAILETPCEALKEKGYFVAYHIAKLIEKYLYVLDAVIISLVLTLIYVSTKTVLDAIRRTKINISPWIEMGKYKLPDKNSRSSIEAMSIPGEEWMKSRYDRLLRPRPSSRHSPRRKIKVDHNLKCS